MLHYPAAISLLNKCLDLCDENDFALKAKIYYRIAQNYWNQGNFTIIIINIQIILISFINRYLGTSRTTMLGITQTEETVFW